MENSTREMTEFKQISYIKKRRTHILKETYWDFPGGSVVKNLPANTRDTGWSPGLGRSHMPQSN